MVELFAAWKELEWTSILLPSITTILVYYPLLLLFVYAKAYRWFGANWSNGKPHFSFAKIWRSTMSWGFLFIIVSEGLSFAVQMVSLGPHFALQSSMSGVISSFPIAGLYFCYTAWFAENTKQPWDTISKHRIINIYGEMVVLSLIVWIGMAVVKLSSLYVYGYASFASVCGSLGLGLLFVFGGSALSLWIEHLRRLKKGLY